MIKLTNKKGLVGLDLEAGTIAATEVHMNGGARVTGGGVVHLPSGAVREGEVADQELLTDALKQLFSENKLGKEVRLGIANQRVVVRTLQLPAIESEKELETAIRFQAHDQMPMPLEQAMLDYQVVGRSTGENGEPTVDVVVVAARKDMLSPLIRAMRRAGLKPMGIDLSAFGMVRALVRESGTLQTVASYEERIAATGVPSEVPLPSALYCSLGDGTNLAIARGTTCVFTRVSQFGIEGIAQRLAERRALTLEHARQWLTHVGLTQPLDAIEGDPETVAAARGALDEGATKLVDEMRLSLEYYGAQAGASAVERVVACGGGAAIPGLVERIERDLGLAVVAPTPQPLAHLEPVTAARLTLSYGLAVEG
jgi:type IV pilus assembly protein PilM